MTHTTGPYTFQSIRLASGKMRYRVVQTKTSLGICGIYQTDGMSEAEIVANGKLLAASAEMKEALRSFVRQWNACGPNSDFGRHFSNVRDTARAALAKATGTEIG